jgi:hypothetical protein
LLCDRFWKKSNEFNITTHQLVKEFKATYDTITRNEIYVIMAEFDFLTKLILLAKTTLKTASKYRAIVRTPSIRGRGIDKETY